MIFYFVVYFLLILIYKIANSRKACHLSLLVLIALIVLRADSVGSDFAGYIQLLRDKMYIITFEDVKAYFNSADMSARYVGDTQLREFFFSMLMNAIFSIVHSEYWTVQIVCLLTLFTFYKALVVFFKKDYPYISLGLLIFFSTYLYFAPFNTLRQALATSFLLLSIALIKKHNDKGWKKKYLPSAILLVVAIFTHNTIMYVLPFFLLYFVNIHEKIIWVSLLIALALNLLNYNFQEFFGILDFVDSYYNLKDGYQTELQANYNVYVHYLGFILHAYMAFFFCWCFHYATEKERRLMNVWFVGLVVYIFLIGSANIGRISEHLYALQIMIVPMIYFRMKGEKHPKFSNTKVFLTLWLFSWFWFYLQSNWYGIVPYVSSFD